MSDNNTSQDQETRCGLTYEEFVKRYLENDPYEYLVHIDAIWASMPVDEQ